MRGRDSNPHYQAYETRPLTEAPRNEVAPGRPGVRLEVLTFALAH